MKKLAPPTQQGWRKKLHLHKRRLLRSILLINDTPHRVALGIAIGTFVAYQPIVGIQMALGAFLAMLTKANMTATLPPAWITNPITIVPIYLGLHRLGNLFVNGPSLSWGQLQHALSTVFAVRRDEGLWASMRYAVQEFLQTIIWPMAIGGLIVGVLNAVLFYWLTYKAIKAYQHHKMVMKLEWLHRHQEMLAQRKAADTSEA